MPQQVGEIEILVKAKMDRRSLQKGGEEVANEIERQVKKHAKESEEFAKKVKKMFGGSLVTEMKGHMGKYQATQEVLGGNGRGGMTSQLSEFLGTKSPMVASLAKIGIGVGLIVTAAGLIVGFLAKMSPALGAEVRMFDTALRLFFKPFGDALASLMRPFMITLLKAAVAWNKFFSKKENAEALKTGMELALTPALGTTDLALKAISIMQPVIEEALNKLKDWFTSSAASFADWIGNLGKKWDDLKSYLGPIWESTRGKAVEVWASIQERVGYYQDVIWSRISSTWDNIRTTVSSVLSSIDSIVYSGFYSMYISILSVLSSLKGAVANIWDAISSTVLGVWENLKIYATNVWSAISDAIISPLKAVWNYISSISIPSWVPVIGGHNVGEYFNKPSGGSPWDEVSPSEAQSWVEIGEGESYYGQGYSVEAIPMQHGGDFMVSEPTLFLAGEAGLERATFMPLNRGRSTGGGGNSYNIAVNVEYTDVKRIVDEVTKKVSSELFRRLAVSG